jgi:hypothetical protein
MYIIMNIYVDIYMDMNMSMSTVTVHSDLT